jgi:hypothetical protein
VGGVDSETIALGTLKTNCAMFRAGDIHPWLFCGHEHGAILDFRSEGVTRELGGRADKGLGPYTSLIKAAFMGGFTG